MGYVIILTVLLLVWAALSLVNVCEEVKKEKPQWGFVFAFILFALVSMYGVLAILIIR